MNQNFLNATIILVLLITSCGTRKVPTSVSQPIDMLDKKWQLVELNGNPVAEKINGKTPSLEFISKDNRYAAVTGCNGVGGEFELEGNNRITFSAGMSTMMACEDMSVEHGLKDVFGKADNFTISEGILSLNKAKMAPLAKFKLIEAESVSLDGTWELDYISGARIAFDVLYPNKKPTITFDTATNKVSGNSSCNSYSGAVTLDGNAIKFGPLASTKMACPGNGESTFFQTLDKVNTYSINENTLTFIMGDIAIMRFQKKS
ncbi:META domain-containing protein [Sphingobacterium pedocola]|uniref:META domain-containing protein n=1 Tax=Sphingobacterium pedocola TaxID=2082722 RepID=A0ABR9TBE8_9SPHI|nr:META domain-containing protein [Sphingobacterium pedocola]MBE8722352.1 META domain-containing protein [Sphingobacterium pedocola]